MGQLSGVPAYERLRGVRCLWLPATPVVLDHTQELPSAAGWHSDAGRIPSAKERHKSESRSDGNAEDGVKRRARLALRPAQEITEADTQ